MVDLPDMNHSFTTSSTPLSQAELEHAVSEKTSRLYVHENFISSCSKCDVRALVNKWATWVLVGWGILMASQVFIVLAGKTVVKNTVREAIIEVMRENREMRDLMSIQPKAEWSMFPSAQGATRR